MPFSQLVGPSACWISSTLDNQTFLPACLALTQTTTRVMIYPSTTKVPHQCKQHNRGFHKAYESPS